MTAESSLVVASGAPQLTVPFLGVAILATWVDFFFVWFDEGCRRRGVVSSVR